MEQLIESEIQSLTDEIMTGHVYGVQFLSELAETRIMSRREYVELIVRSLFVQRISDEMKRKQQWRNVLCGLTFTISIVMVMKILIDRI